MMLFSFETNSVVFYSHLLIYMPHDIGMIGLYYIKPVDPLIRLMNAVHGHDDVGKLRLHKLTLNVIKSKFMNIHFSRKFPLDIRLYYGGVSIEEVDEFKYLEIIIDEDLTWQASHINVLCSKLSRRIGNSRKLSKCLLSIICLSLYFPMIHCHQNYFVYFVCVCIILSP